MLLAEPSTGALKHSTKLLSFLLPFRASSNWCYIMTFCLALNF